MRFKQRQSVKLPEVDLIPMLNVMMGILAFFVMITMTLSNEKLLPIQLPGQQEEPAVDLPPSDPFIIELNAQGQILLNDQPIDQVQIRVQMETYLTRNPDNTVFILPNQQLPYEQVIQFLAEMREIGGDRVSLALEATQTSR